MASVHEQVPFRTSQISTLTSLLGDDSSDDPWPSVYIYGHTATGKSVVVQTVLKSLENKHVIINCVEVYYNPKLLFELVLNCVSGHKPTMEDRQFKNCGNMNDFVRTLAALLDESRKKLCLVFDKAERLREMDGNVLPALLRLHELTGQRICTIFISELAWEKFKFGTGLLDPFIIHFNEYSKDETMKILLMHLNHDYPDDFKMNYIRLVLSVVLQVCCNLSELIHIVNMNFNVYVEPVKSGEASMNDVKKLWRNLEPHLLKSLQRIYFRHAAISSNVKMKAEDAVANSKETNYKNLLIELPFYSKFLLIAAYLASYNPSRTDKRFFVKGRDKLTKQSKFMQKHARATNQLLGPKPFPLDRLLAIFYSIVEERVAPTAAIFSQISSLVTLHLLTAIGGDGNLDMPKYKCAVSLDMIRSISKTVDFDIIQYLYDFI